MFDRRDHPSKILIPARNTEKNQVWFNWVMFIYYAKKKTCDNSRHGNKHNALNIKFHLPLNV